MEKQGWGKRLRGTVFGQLGVSRMLSATEEILQMFRVQPSNFCTPSSGPSSAEELLMTVQSQQWTNHSPQATWTESDVQSPLLLQSCSSPALASLLMTADGHGAEQGAGKGSWAAARIRHSRQNSLSAGEAASALF